MCVKNYDDVSSATTDLTKLLLLFALRALAEKNYRAWPAENYYVNSYVEMSNKKKYCVPPAATCETPLPARGLYILPAELSSSTVVLGLLCTYAGTTNSRNPDF